MTELAGLQICPGCGSHLPAIDGVTHAYMTSSPACWAAFNAVTAREYSDPGLMDIHRLSVDAFAVQHPGDGSRRGIQSVGLHLARLMVQLEDGLRGSAANDAMLKFAARKADLPELPPRAAYSVTVADVVGTIAPVEHRKAVRHWAQTAWEAWSDQHSFIRVWANSCRGR